MPLQGPFVVVSENPAEYLVAALGKAGAFPIVETRWADAPAAVSSIEPAAVIVDDCERIEPGAAAAFERQIDQSTPLVPVVARATGPLPFARALPIAADAPIERLLARLTSALRVRELHSTVLRRMEKCGADEPKLPAGDPLDDASVLALGRGRSFPTLSVALGERVGVIGALSVEAAGRYLAARHIDGIAIGDGFSPRVVDAFLLALAEDARFRDLPVAVLGGRSGPAQMPNLLREGDPLLLVARMLPLVRLHAFNARLKRMLKSLECKGLLDPETGLLSTSAFGDDLTRAVDQANERGGALSIARISFEPPLDRRVSLDAARVVSQLVRQVDFACRQDDGSILVAFTGTDLRAAHVVARRLASALKRGMLRTEPQMPTSAPHVTLATLKPGDTVITLMSRVTPRTVAAE
jgi:GGDEF domain-containing protein